MIRFKVKQNVTRDLKKLADLDVRKAMEMGGMKATEIVSERADQGKGIDGNLAKYSDKYEDFKASTGRNTKPDLQFSGEMLRSQFSKVVKKGTQFIMFVKFPKRQHTKAKINIDKLAEHLNKKRPFIGLNKQNTRKVIDVIIKELRKSYAKLKLN